jgi:transposase-like protein
VNTIADEAGVTTGRRRRRIHSDEFKAEVVAACKPAGVSMAAVAMAHGINANLARRWVVAAERRSGAQSAAVASGVAPASFVALALPPAAPAPADIRIELRRGATAISVSWPCAVASECAVWLRELLR